LKKAYKILIVDDDAMVRRLYHRILTLKGYSVSTSDTAVRIFNTVAEHVPDIIIMDNQMPIVSGTEAIRQLKSSERFRSIPVILFSSVSNISVLAKECGADSHLSKLESNDHLFAILEDMIELTHHHA